MAGPDWTTWLYWIGGALLALFGFALLLWALYSDRARGRKRCPKCWYDLSGIASNEATAPLVCSECGKQITHVRKLSKTRRKWRWAFVGVLLIVGPAGFVAWLETRNFDWNTVKPVWLLKREGKVDSPTGEAARKELVRRMQSDLFSDAQVHDLAEFVLEIQADPNAFWRGRQLSIDSTWGDLFEEAWDRQRLTTEQISRYLETAFGASFTLTPRARIRTGTVLPLEVKTREPRLSLRWQIGLKAANHFVAMSELVNSPPSLHRGSPARPRDIGSSSAAGGWTTEVWRCDLPAGRHTCSFTYEFAVLEQKGQLIDGTKQHVADYDNALVRWRKTYEVTFEVVDGESVERVPDATLEGTIRNAIQFTLGAKELERGRTMYGGRFGIILVEPLPVALSFNVYGRADGKEFELGSFASPANRSRIDNVGFDALTQDPQAIFPNHDSIDIIFRTNTERAERTVEIDSVWDGEMVFENVPLRRGE